MIIRWDSPWRFFMAGMRTVEFWGQGRPVLTPFREAQHRLAICGPCRFNDHGQCRKCTCFLVLKVRLAAEECPDIPPRWKRLTLARKLPPQT